ncbi:D-2-hydroxyacid dehydrogenase [Gemmobacter tilapiae]|uniref:D-2-hydroxyacid dehydrogenase n=2 Tax=Neogemmobacter tilapiae TaxID=875041 RepID=A0A918TTI5_9RHOB|nr:FAD-binding oxidoreductase [Gemmobacter tilapiae]GHC61239.1 D-2-hydroxyacid dehydrogenase [Gemmobacter tilapiae]
MIETLQGLVGRDHVLTGRDMAPYCGDWTGKYQAEPLAVVRPANTDDVAAVVKAVAAAGGAIVPAGGRTGLVGGLMTRGGVMLSLERMNRIHEIRAASRLARVEAGVILSSLHEAAEAEGLYFPLWFGARGSATIGGVLSTNAGGSNVLRYGSTRGLCLGLEVVLADGRVLNLQSELHKDNSGYDLKDLFIGAEGTLGVITSAIMRLVPAPRAHATAMLGMARLGDALDLLNRLQGESGGLVEAFEFMPASYIERLVAVRPDVGAPFAGRYPVNILVELGATAPHLAEAGPDGQVALTGLLEGVLAPMMEQGLIEDAVLAQNEAQRRALWQRRELAAEITFAKKPAIDTDVALPLDGVEAFLTGIAARLPGLDAGASDLAVAHLGDGNVHYTVFPSREDAALSDRIVSAIEDVVQDLGGSFSAEHGVGLSKKPSMARRKDPVALAVMANIKSALDPKGVMNPGKVLP